MAAKLHSQLCPSDLPVEKMGSLHSSAPSSFQQLPGHNPLLEGVLCAYWEELEKSRPCCFPG